MRYLANDHFWFTFFHEAAHLLLHSRKTVFLDGNGYGSAGPKEEEEGEHLGGELSHTSGGVSEVHCEF